MAKSANMIGLKFYKLTVRSRAPEDSTYGHAMFVCDCQCGKTVTMRGTALRSGAVKSCGCHRNEMLVAINLTHGLRESAEYSIWCDMKTRCYNRNSNAFSNYGGRGITVCDEWLHSFETFYEDMGPRPSPEHSLDRKDNDKDYSKSNCRWATIAEQNNNKRNNVVIEYDGEVKNLATWCRELGLSYRTMRHRLKKGIPFEEAMIGAQYKE